MMFHETEVRQIARVMVCAYGADAVTQAKAREDDSKQIGDYTAAASWADIAQKIEDWQRGGRMGD